MFESLFGGSELEDVDRRLAKLEAKIDLIMKHLGVQEFDADLHLQGSIEKLIGEGKKIKAIKLYRDESRVGLKEAKDKIDQIAATL